MDYSTYGNYGAESTASSFLAAFYIGFILFLLIAVVVSIISLWKIFEKANEPGWKAIIPIYNMYILYKLIGISPWWILITYCSGFLSAIPVIGSIASLVITVYAAILQVVSLSNSFGKDSKFAVGLYFLGPIFYCILAFGSAEYLGPRPMNDFVFKNKN